eukprot:GCRY01001369.1.p1 GENE.GCRY01001369.1~~GCRY01001369.1.p1  ORF type:complete len:136 (-),score=1.03 GCRY01001369.1:295-681(-)
MNYKDNNKNNNNKSNSNNSNNRNNINNSNNVVQKITFTNQIKNQCRNNPQLRIKFMPCPEHQGKSYHIWSVVHDGKRKFKLIPQNLREEIKGLPKTTRKRNQQRKKEKKKKKKKKKLQFQKNSEAYIQ